MKIKPESSVLVPTTLQTMSSSAELNSGIIALHRGHETTPMTT